MIPGSIEHEIVVGAPVEQAWGAVVEPGQISEWFADGVELDARPGGSGRYAFTDKATSHQQVVPLRVEAVEAPHRFVFRWDYPEGAEPDERNSVRVEFALEAEGSGTRLRVTESGFRELDRPEDEKLSYVDDHRKGWEIHLGRLRDHVAAHSGFDAG